jgi:hypothetical protein
MKKNFSSRLLAVFCFIAIFALGCGSDDPVATASCENDASAFQSALNDLMADIENSDKCKAFKAAAAELLDCPGLTAGNRAEYKSTVDSIVCN